MSNYVLIHGQLYSYDELYHHGVKGQKWGVRRYQNADGSLTPAGQKRVYKTLKRYDKQKDVRARLGQAVGEDESITNAARKVLPLYMKTREVDLRVTKLEHEMFSTHEKEVERLRRNKKLTEDQIEDLAWQHVEKKHGKQSDALDQESQRVYSEYQKASKEVAYAYLGKYGDTPISKVSKFHKPRTAVEALVTQMKWGIGSGRLKPTADESKHLRDVRDWADSKRAKIRNDYENGKITSEERDRLRDDLNIETQRRVNKFYGV